MDAYPLEGGEGGGAQLMMFCSPQYSGPDNGDFWVKVGGDKPVSSLAISVGQEFSDAERTPTTPPIALSTRGPLLRPPPSFQQVSRLKYLLPLPWSKSSLQDFLFQSPSALLAEPQAGASPGRWAAGPAAHQASPGDQRPAHGGRSARAGSVESDLSEPRDCSQVSSSK